MKAGCDTAVINSSRFECAMTAILSEHRHLAGEKKSIGDASFAFTEHVMGVFRFLRYWRIEDGKQISNRRYRKTGGIRKLLESHEYADIIATVSLIKTPSAASDSRDGDEAAQSASVPDLRGEHGVTAAVASVVPHHGAGVTAAVASLVPHQGALATASMSLPDVFRPDALPWPSCFAPESSHDACDADKEHTLVGRVTTNQRKRKLNTLANRKKSKALIIGLVCSCTF